MTTSQARPGRKSGVRVGTIQSVERALDIMEAVGTQPTGISLTQLSQILDLNISTCHHLASTLLERNYLDQDPESKRYLLGPKLLQFKHVALEQADVYTRAMPYLGELNRNSTETVHLAVVRRGELITIAKLPSQNAVKVDRSMIGESEALHCTATGKSILAFLPADELEQLLTGRELRRFTEKTVTDPARLRQELAQVQEQGFALDLEEFEPGICCVGAPIRNHAGAVLASFSVSLPVFRAQYSRMQELIRMVLHTSDQISRRLGYLP